MRTLPRRIAVLVAALATWATPAAGVDTDYLFSFGTAGSGDGQFNQPVSLAFGPGGVLYVVDSGNQRIQKFDTEGNFLGKWSLFRPPLHSITVTPDGSVFVAAGTHLYKFTGDGTQLINRGPVIDQSSCCHHLTSDAAGIVYYTTNFTGTTTVRYDANLNSLGCWLCVTWSYHGMVIDPDGEVFLAGNDPVDGVKNIFKRTSAGAPIAQWPTMVYELGVDALGNVYGLDLWANRVRVYDNDGVFLTEFGSPGSGPGQFNLPQDVAIGPDGRIYVADFHNQRIQVFGDGSTPARPATWGRIKGAYR